VIVRRKLRLAGFWLIAFVVFSASPVSHITAQELPPGTGEMREPTRDENGRIVPLDGLKKADTQRDAPAEAVQINAQSCEADSARPGAVRIENRHKTTRPAGPVTFGVFFKQGMVPDAVTAVDLPSQVDVKRRWPDGSLKHVILTIGVPELAPGAQIPVSFKPARGGKGDATVIRRGKMIEALASVEVRLDIHSGPQLVSRLQHAKPQRNGNVWLQGNQVVEYLMIDVPVDADGRADPDLEVRYHVRHYPAAGTTRVAVIVENTKWTAPGNIPYDVEIRIDGKPAFQHDEVGAWPKYPYIGHAKGARWIKRFWLGRDPGDAHVRHDVPCLVETGLLPRYDMSISVEPKTTEQQVSRWLKLPRNILQNGVITPYFPTTGGRSDIGPLPSWAAIYLLSQDPGAWAVTRVGGDLSGSVNIHLRDPKTGAPVSIDDYPGFSLNTRGTSMKIPIRDKRGTSWVGDIKSHFTPDRAHQGSFAYLPYLLTGDFYYLEEMAFWANYNFLQLNAGYRAGARGLIKGQVRGMAWQLRNLVHIAALVPDDDHLKPYFESKLSENLKQFNAFIDGAEASPLGVFKEKRVDFAWGKEWRDRFGAVAPWQQNFLAWAVSHVADHGYSQAVPFRDYLMRMPIGLVVNPDQISPHTACAYSIIVGLKVNKKYTPAKSWKDVDYLTYEAEKPAGKQLKRLKQSGGDYCRILWGTLAAATHAKLPGARAALDWVDSTQQGALKRHFARDPTWALAP